MSQTGRRDTGYPRTGIDQKGRFRFENFCDGPTAAQCSEYTNTIHHIYWFRVNKSVLFNRSLIMRNPSFELASEAAEPDEDCTHGFGPRQPFWVAFSADGQLTWQQVKDQGQMFDQAPPFDFVVPWNKLPQPNSSNWDGRIYVHVAWDDPQYLSRQLNLAGVGATGKLFDLLRHNYDIRV